MRLVAGGGIPPGDQGILGGWERFHESTGLFVSGVLPRAIRYESSIVYLGESVLGRGVLLQVHPKLWEVRNRRALHGVSGQQSNRCDQAFVNGYSMWEGHSCPGE